MARVFSAMIAAIIIASPVEASLPTFLGVPPVSEGELHEVFGTSGWDTNFRIVLEEKGSSDRDLFANASHDAMDGWWANTGAVLIAASLRN